MVVVDLVLRWAHILAAAVLVGGVVFLRVAALPAIQTGLSSETAHIIRKRWSRLVMVTSGMLLLSGLINFARIVAGYEMDDGQFPGNLYHMFFGIKFLLALAVFFLAAALSGRSKIASYLQQRERFWLSWLVVLSVAVVLIAGVMKLASRSEKLPQESAEPNASRPPFTARIEQVSFFVG